ncbi:MAG: hypothetical protein FJY88_08360 [Candidatus Eisenbacteria bacterium]|nr:hypothetical protein [Candidatus Eisenbacteria bacterium]
MNRTLLLVLLSSALVIVAPQLHALPSPIILDGLDSDWDGIAQLLADPAGDGGTSGIDLRSLSAADDARFLFLRFDVGTELLLNDGHRLTLYLDTDANSATGLSVGGIGAELEWRFGDREGVYRFGAQSTNISQSDIRFRAMPTVTGSIFEIAIGRDARPDGSHLLFAGSAVRILLWDTQAGDRLPDAGGIATYTMDGGPPPAETSIPLGRQEADDLRMITYNVETDGPWDSLSGPRFGRQLAAIEPQLLHFQEIYDHTAQQTADFVETWLPSGPGEEWYAAGNQDCKTVSRFPIEQTWSLDGNLAALIDTRPLLEARLLVVNAHLPCCSNNSSRQAEIDRILSFIKDAKSPGGTVTVDSGTPILIVGDLNLVTLRQHLLSLLTGDIVNEGAYGPDFAPDWDGSGLADLISRQTAKRVGYTWRRDGSSYWPGHLDFFIYTDSVLGLGNHYLLYTPEMPADTLAHYGLLASDSEVSDHILSCADFRPVGPADTVDNCVAPIRLCIGPNPGRPSRAPLGIRVGLQGGGMARLEILDAAGRSVAHPIGRGWISLGAGSKPVFWNGKDDGGRDLPSGLYFVRVGTRDSGGNHESTAKWAILR